MKLNATDGTQKTIEDLRHAWSILQSCCLRIQEINNGYYNFQQLPIQFDYCTCSELANWTNNINDIVKKLNKVVYKDNDIQ